jgi:predicted GNAT family N-acyltransferase
VACNDEFGVVGFYTLNVCSIRAGDLPTDISRKLPRYNELPGILIGRLARDLRVKGLGVGEILLVDVFRRVQSINEQAAVCLIIVDSKDAEASEFYKRFGFVSFESDPQRLFVTVASVVKGFALANS